MSVKPLAIVAALVLCPLVLVAATQDPGLRRRFALDEARGLVQGLRQDLGSLRQSLTDAEARAAAAEAKAAAMQAELDEGLDLLVQSACAAECDCAPSRSLITHHEWLDARGHDEHAEQLLDRICRSLRNDPSRINRLAWSLMSEEESAGKYDSTALALAVRMQRDGRRLDHRMLDTLAFARFLNGELAAAVDLQQQALGQDDRSEYRRRLRTYEAALVAMQASRPEAQSGEGEGEAEAALIVEVAEAETGEVAETEATWAAASAAEND